VQENKIGYIGNETIREMMDVENDVTDVVQKRQ
jgi:hypothetical protein